MKKELKLNISDYPSLGLFRRILSSKSTTVEVFIRGEEISLVSIDQAKDTRYILQEKTKIQDVTLDKSKIEVSDEAEDISIDLDFDYGGIVNEEDKVNKDFISFSVPSSFLDILATFRDCTLKIEDKMLTIASADNSLASYEMQDAYLELDWVDDVFKSARWEKLPIQKIKSIIQVLDFIEPKKIKQKLTISEKSLYINSEYMACESITEGVKESYTLDYEILSYIRYITKADSDVRISKIDTGQILMNIDGLNIIYNLINQDSFNILTEIKDLKFDYLFDMNKDILERLKMCKSFNPTEKVEILGNGGKLALRIPRLITICKCKALNDNFRLIVNLDTLLQALKVSKYEGSVYCGKINDSFLIKIKDSVVAVIEAEHYEKE